MASITLSIEQVHQNADHVIVAGYCKTSSLYDIKMPLIGTKLNKFPQIITPSTKAYGGYLFAGAQETGRGSDATDTKLLFIPPEDPLVGEANRVFSREFERDPITHDIWDVKRRISVAPSTVESPAGEVSTSQQMANGLWVNTTRTITLPGRVQTILRQTEEFGLITMTQQYVDTATGVAGVSALGSQTEAEFKPVNDAFGLLTRASFSAPVTRTDTEHDPETWCLITITRTLATSPVTTQAAGTEVSSRQINAGLYLNVTRTIDLTCAGTGYSLRGYVPFERPRVLEGFTAAVGEDGLHLNLNPIAKGGYEKQISARRDVTFEETEPAEETLFQIIPTYFNYRGTYFNVPWGNMVTDEITIFDIGGTFVETVTFDASTPTKTEYFAAIGTHVRWAQKTSRWRFNLYRNEQLYILLE